MAFSPHHLNFNSNTHQDIFPLFLVVLKIEYRALCMLSKWYYHQALAPKSIYFDSDILLVPLKIKGTHFMEILLVVKGDTQ